MTPYSAWLKQVMIYMKIPFFDSGTIIRDPKVGDGAKTENYSQRHDGDVNDMNAFRHFNLNK